MERLKAKRDHIVNEEMPENAKEIARAREFGDLSENAEYHAAREKQGLLQAKADQINGELARRAAAHRRHRQHRHRVRGARSASRTPRRQRRRDQLHPARPAGRRRKSGIINYLTPLGAGAHGAQARGPRAGRSRGRSARSGDPGASRTDSPDPSSRHSRPSCRLPDRPPADTRAARRDLRISITDRCNFRCTYCMPKEIFGREARVPAARRDPDYEEIIRASAQLRASRRRGRSGSRAASRCCGGT